MEVVKKICKLVGSAAVSTLTACIVRDAYNKYAHNEVAKANLKQAMKKLNPFN